MGLKGTMSCQTEIKCHGDVFHELFKHKPHHVSKFANDKVQSCEIQDGDYGKVGSILLWKYKHEEKEKFMKTKIESVDEKEKFMKTKIESVDEKEKLITFKAIEGDVFDDYNEFSFTLQTESRDEEIEHDGKKEEHKSISLNVGTHHEHEHHGEKEEHKYLISWTFEYEKKHEEAPAPTSYLDWALGVVEDVEAQASDVKKFIKDVEAKASDVKKDVIEAVKNSPLGLIHEIMEEGSIFG